MSLIKRLLLLLLFTSQAALGVQLSTVYSKYKRQVLASAAGQNYVLLDADVLAHSRRDLSDLRLYDASSQEHPYALQIEAVSQSLEEVPAKLINKGFLNGQLSFELSTSVEEYDQVELKIRASDFVIQARVEGANRTTGPWTKLGSYPLYNFGREGLGRNTSIRLQSPARFQYLRLTLPGLKPEDVTAASVGFLPKRKPRYLRLPYSAGFEQKDKHTLIHWTQPEGVPVDRISFDLPSSEVNFRRPVTIQCEEKNRVDVIARGDISRIHLVRKGRLIESEDLQPEMTGSYCSRYLLDIDNGDNPPLQISAVYPEMRQRRLYFEVPAPQELQLFYGDEKLATPVYDYAKLFAEESDTASSAVLQPEVQNPAYQPRPDDRPWSERHPAVLWTVMLIAVLGLGVVALRGLRT